MKNGRVYVGFFEEEQEDDGERCEGKVHVHEVVNADEFLHQQASYQTKRKQV